jgi:hypothetical protein
MNVLALKIIKGEFKKLSTRTYPKNISMLVTSLLQVNPAKRPTIEEALGRLFLS